MCPLPGQVNGSVGEGPGLAEDRTEGSRLDPEGVCSVCTCDCVVCVFVAGSVKCVYMGACSL